MILTRGAGAWTGKTIQAPERDNDLHTRERAARRVAEGVAGPARKNHFPGLEFISQEAAEQLSDPIGNKTSGYRQSGKALLIPRERCISARQAA